MGLSIPSNLNLLVLSEFFNSLALFRDNINHYLVVGDTVKHPSMVLFDNHHNWGDIQDYIEEALLDFSFLYDEY